MRVTACNPPGWGDQQTQLYLWVRSCENFQCCHALPPSGVSDVPYRLFCTGKLSLGLRQSAELSARGSVAGMSRESSPGAAFASCLCSSICQPACWDGGVTLSYLSASWAPSVGTVDLFGEVWKNHT